MKEIFDAISIKCSKTTTVSYSTSFSLGIKFLNKKLHNPIYAIYGFVRFADEIVDTFHDYDKQYLFAKFKADTYEAIEQKISLNPILNSFQKVVHTYSIDKYLIDTFLDSMEMDLKKQEFDKKLYDQYILGSAEVVGLMCLRVFCESNLEQYEDLKHYAMKLGSAFQKVNFLRDIKADNEDLGRTYFPEVNLDNFTLADKLEIEQNIQDEFDEALVGIKKLPTSSRKGVYLAYYYYTVLFKKIKNVPPHRIMNERIRIPNFEKMILMLKSNLRHQFNIL
jgi:phytoene/squalene synthetase